jgi:hypothetical protein
MLRLTVTCPGNGFGQASRVGRRAQQVHSLHEAAVVIEGHHDRIRCIAARDDGDVSILNHLVDNSPQTVASIGKVDDSHFFTPLGRIDYYFYTIL